MTLLPLGDSRPRIAFNRDESRTRAAARPPELRRAGDRRMIMPVDPVSDGTWIAVNDAGLAGALLNVYEPDARPGSEPAPVRSRGTILPGLMAHATIDEVEVGIGEWEASEFAPFRLVLTDAATVFEICGNGSTLESKRHTLKSSPRLFTSSGLGDALVQGPRRRLFEESFAAPSDPVEAQDAFHRHQWPDRPELSVCMSRREAVTVSYTVLEFSERDARMTYYPAPPDKAAEPLRISLETRASA